MEIENAGEWEQGNVEQGDEKTVPTLDEQKKSKWHTLAPQLHIKYKEFLRDIESMQTEKGVLRNLIKRYIDTFQESNHKISILKKAWKVIQEAVSDAVQEHFEESRDLQT